MFELTQCLDIGQSLAQTLRPRRPGQIDFSSGGAIPEWRLLNQEKDGTLIYTWDDVSLHNRQGPVVTYVAIYDPVSQADKILWTNDSRIYITSCSVNLDRTLIAYTTCEKTSSLTQRGQSKNKLVYKAYLAEIFPQKRVFSLNIERPHYLKVQFLYGQVTATVDKKAHMLLFLHKESIGLYHIPLARADRGIIMSDQPVTEQLTKRFIWCQWDCQHQRLYYAHHRRCGRKEQTTPIPPILSCIQFSQQSRYEHMLDLPLMSSFPTLKANSRSTYLDLPLDPGIPDGEVNMCVLSQPNGTLCICHQHPVNKPPDPDPEQDNGHVGKEMMVDIEYSVTMPHHAKVLQGSSSQVPYTVAETSRLLFTWLNDYLVVCLPGWFVHVLNVSIEFEPCHHILLHKSSWEECGSDDGDRVQTVVKRPVEEVGMASAMPTDSSLTSQSNSLSLFSSECSSLGELCHFFQKHSGHGGSSMALYDGASGQVYQLGINTEVLVDVFASCYMTTTRQALLHYVIRQGRDMALLKKMFEMLANDCASPEVPVLMQEFLVGMTYYNMRRQVERDVFQLLPFTNTDTFRGLFEKNCQGERLSRLSYLPLRMLNIGTKTIKERQQRRLAEDLWDNLCFHLRSRQLEPHHRFSQDKVLKDYKDMLRAMEKGHPPARIQLLDQASFLGKLSARVRTSFSVSLPQAPGVKSRSDSALGVLPSFLMEGDQEPHQDRLFSLTEKLFSSHIGKYLRKDSKIKVANVAKEYISCQMQQARQLCHMIWSVRGTSSPTEYIPMNEPSSDEEYELFQLLERFYLAVQELAYPVPNGFQTYFTVLGFRSLDLSMFLQYVDRGVLHLTGEFVAQIMEDLSDDEENVKIKLQIISRLPMPLAEDCLQKWDHPIASRHIAMQQVATLLKDSDESSERKRWSRLQHFPQSLTHPIAEEYEHGAGGHSMFHPLDNLLDLIHEKELEQSIGEDGGGHPPAIDSRFIEEVATHHTRQYTNYDLSTINF